MSYPGDLKYTKDHEWVRLSGDVAVIGITDYAQQQLGDVVYVDLPDVGRSITAGESFGSIESVKAVSELFAPMSGEVVAVNPALKDHPKAVAGLNVTGEVHLPGVYVGQIPGQPLAVAAVELLVGDAGIQCFIE